MEEITGKIDGTVEDVLVRNVEEGSKSTDVVVGYRQQQIYVSRRIRDRQRRQFLHKSKGVLCACI